MVYKMMSISVDLQLIISWLSDISSWSGRPQRTNGKRKTWILSLSWRSYETKSSLHIKTISQVWKRSWRDWISMEKLVPYILKHCLDRLEYSEELLRPEENCCHSDFSDEYASSEIMILSKNALNCASLKTIINLKSKSKNVMGMCSKILIL